MIGSIVTISLQSSDDFMEIGSISSAFIPVRPCIPTALMGVKSGGSLEVGCYLPQGLRPPHW